MSSPEQLCPSCGKENACRIANGSAYQGPCWCEAFTIPAEVQRRLAEAHPVRACLCPDCLVGFSESYPKGVKPAAAPGLFTPPSRA